ncbi:MAG: NUDIX domain-containing protein [Actinobacteria bacterium]|nr:NUDIX domain-containing protein [Actinomycetota bacterium]
MSPAARALRLPDSFLAHAAEVLQGGAEPVVPRDAATVMLLRAAGAGMEVYLLRRQPSMAFAPGAVVFPGGGVDPRDADGDIAWAGPDPAEWGQLIGAPAQLARELVCAAVRETFEESGVLLAGPSPDTIVADTRGEDWEAGRRALVDRSLSLAEFLAGRRLVLRSDLLRPWARWVTPVTEERRFDTRFFAARLPEGQLTRDVSGEADQVAWMTPAAAIEAARRREIVLLPPTAVTLAELAACRTVAGAVAARRRITARIPEVTMSEGAVWLTIPEGLEYPL